jgi:hypothetical protein
MPPLKERVVTLPVNGLMLTAASDGDTASAIGGTLSRLTDWASATVAVPDKVPSSNAFARKLAIQE